MLLCIGELAVAMPVSGNTQAYCDRLFNPAAGFTVGWITWIGCAVSISSQLVASCIILDEFFPDIPEYAWVLFFAALLYALNLLSSKEFGEAEFWFSSFKIIAIVALVIVGGLTICGVGSSGMNLSGGLKNFFGDGLLPTGFAGVISTMMIAVFAFGGVDTFVFAAGETENPEKNLPPVMNYSMLILIGSYSLAMLVLGLIIHWQEANMDGSPFAVVFGKAGIPAAKAVVSIIVLTSALSSANSFVYACTRALWSLAKHDACFARLNKRQIPHGALLASMAFALLALASSVFAADTVYLFLMSFIGASNMVIYAIDCLCQYKFRRRFLAAGNKLSDLKYKTPLHPWTALAGIVLYMFILGGMAFDATERLSLYVGIPCYILIYYCYKLFGKRN